MIEIGSLVVFVPSHDQEYRAQPNYGVVKAVENDLVLIEYQDHYGNLNRRYNQIAYTAVVEDKEDVVRLLKKINDMAISFLSLVYYADVVVQDEDSSKFENLKNAIRQRNRYHIN